MAMTIVDRFHPQRRRALQAAVDADRLRLVDEMALLEPKQMLPLTIFSLMLFVVGGVFFIGLNLFAYTWRTGSYGFTAGGGQVLLWLLINIVGYIIILPIHELLHGAAFAFWGGKPYYGTKLPIALYCSAKNQIFARNYYLVVGLAPFVVITLAGIIFTLLAPILASYTLLATVGNVSGAAGDLWVVWRLRSASPSAFVEDLEAGYRVWAVTAPVHHATIVPGA